MTATQTAPEIITLRTVKVDGMNAIYIGPAVLVESQTTAGVWYICEAGRCTCPSYAYRGACKHTAVAAWVDECDRETAQPIVDRHLDLERDELARYDATGEWPAIWGRRS